jgi:hypothetical protein
MWETRFTSYLYTLDKGVHKAILPPQEHVDDDADFDAKNRWAYAELVQVLDERSLQIIMADSPNDGRNSLKTLKQHYASTEKPRVLKLYEELTTIRMSPDEDVTDYLIRAERAATGLNAAGENITDNLIIAMILKGLPDDYKPFVVVHTQMDKTKTLSEFKAALHTYASTEACRISAQHSALTTKGHTPSLNSKTTQCLSCGKHGHSSKVCRTKSKLYCNFCKKPGHNESVCFTKKRGVNTHAEKTKLPDRDCASTSTTYTFTTNGHTDRVKTGYLLVDCGATCHIVNYENMFVSYDNTFDPKNHAIELADGYRSNDIAIARGNAKTTLVDAQGNLCEVTLKDALLAPKFPTSLFSVRAATDAGAKIIFSKGAAELVAKGTTFKLTRGGQLYFLPTNNTNSARVTRTLEEWHRTLGHMNYEDVLHLQSVTEGMTINKQQSEKSCTICLENKLTKLPKSYDSPPVHAVKKLERIHTDICGPIQPQSSEGHRYIINFIDEYSSLIFVYLLRTKDEASQALKQFLADIAPFGTPKEVHSDNGTEYTSRTFRQILLDHSIKQTTTAPYSPYQNGKSERSWRSLLDMARCLLADASLPKFLWPYAVRHAQYLRNRSYQRRTRKTAYELFTGSRPDMRHIHPFGAPCTVLIEGQKQKLSARGQTGIYLGMNTSSQGYYVLNPTNNSISTSRNVKVHDMSNEDDLNCYHHNETVRDPRTPSEYSESNVQGNSSTTTEGVNQPDDVIQTVEPTGNDRPHRETKRPGYLKDYYCTANVDYACTVIPTMPENYEEATNSAEAERWKAAMDVEINTLIENDTWEIVPLPHDRTETKGKWVYAMKQSKQEGEVTYKARYVAKGYSQVEGIDYDETFSPTTRFTTVRMLIQKAVNESLHLHQMDVKGAYLNAPIDKEIYVQQPPGYEFTHESGAHFTCRLKKSLYGLKQSGRNWHITLTEYLTSKHFTVSDNDPCEYTLNTSNGQLIILFWVDDIILASNNMTLIDDMKRDLGERFKMDDRGELRWFLGIDFKHLQDGSIVMSQERYIESIIHRSKLQDCNPVDTPAEKGLQLSAPSDTDHLKAVQCNFPYRSAVGSLIYLMVATRPDISWIVSKLSQFLDKPGLAQINAAKRVMKYLQGTKSHGLKFTKTEGYLQGYVDADWANDTTDRRSTTGYIFTLGSAPISWKTRKQQTVALSSCEAEYMSMSDAAKEAIYLRGMLQSVGIAQPNSTNIYCDNRGALALSKNGAKQHDRSKHIDVRYHFIREQTDVTFVHVRSNDNMADFLTKSLGPTPYRRFLRRLQIEGACSAAAIC